MRKIKTFVTSLKFQLICGTIFLLLVLNCAEGVIGYFQFTRSFVEEYNESAFRTAETAAAIVNADHIQDYLATGGDSDEYRNSLARMNTLCQKQTPGRSAISGTPPMRNTGRSTGRCMRTAFSGKP